MAQYGSKPPDLGSASMAFVPIISAIVEAQKNISPILNCGTDGRVGFGRTARGI